MDFYMDIILQMISLIAYSTIIIRTTWIFVPNRFPKLPADKKWPNYVITSLHVLIIFLLLTTFGFYCLDDSRDFGEEFRKMDRVIEKTELHINNTIGALPEIGDPEIRFERLSKNITEDIRNEIGLSIVEIRPELHLKFDRILGNITDWYFYDAQVNCPSIIHYEDLKRVDKKNLNFRFKIGHSAQEKLLKVMGKFDSPYQNLSIIISNKNMELANENLRITRYLEPTKTFFEKIVSSFKISGKMFNKRKVDSIEKENSRNVVLFVPFLFAIIFSLFSIVTNIIWGKYIPRISSIILCILFYILSIQVIIISTYFAYNIPEDIFTQEPEYFKLFDIEISSYDNKSNANAHKTFLNCDHEKSTIISALEKGFFILEYPLLQNFHDELSNTINQNLSDIENLSSTIISGTISDVESYMEEFIKLKGCDAGGIQEKNREYIEFLNETINYLQLCLELSWNIENITYFTSSVVQNNLKEINRTIYEPIFKINQSLIEADFKCQPLYNALLNGFISSHQPDQNVYRNMFKITVMGCSTLCLVLYLLALGRRINQTTCDSIPPKENTDLNKKSRKAKKDVAPRSPKRF